MLLLPTSPELRTLLNVALHLLQSQPAKAQEAVELIWMIRNHIGSDTGKHNFKLLLIAEHLIKGSPPRIREAMELINIVQAENIPFDVSMQLAKMLCSHGLISESQALLSGIGWMNLTVDSEAVNLLKAFTEVVFELLRQECYEIAKKMVSKIEISGIISKEIIPLIQIRLNFLNYILFNGPIYDKQLQKVISNQNCPSVLSALPGYPAFLQRKAEYSIEKEEEQKAVKWLSKVFVREHRCAPEKSCILNTVRWLVLNGQAAEAINVMDQHYRANPEYKDGYTFLSLFFWIVGDIMRARFCLSAETFRPCKEPSILFARAVAVGIIGEVEKAVNILEELCRISRNFFIESRESTVWGMFSLLLKAVGQEKLSTRAIKLSEKTDRLHQYRSHLYHRIPIGSQSLAIPPFVMPSELNT